MLDTGFEPDIPKLEELGLPSKDERFTSIFSTAFPDKVQKLAKHFLRDNYIFPAVDTLGGANEDIPQTIEEVPQSNKKDRLLQLLEQNLKSGRCLIFVETKRSADYIGALLSQKKLRTTTMHDDRTPKQRSEAIQQLTNGKCPVLVATYVAARDLDFPLISYVINYDLPDTIDFYIHQIGRTGHSGKSISFFDADRESDKRIAPELISKLVEAGQAVPDFLKQYADGASAGFTGGYHSQTADMRSGGNSFGSRNHQAGGPSGGSASAGGAAAEEWD